MLLNKKNLINIVTCFLLFIIITGCTVTSCESTPSTTKSSISGVLTVPITGDQIYESNDSFNDNLTDATEISYGDTAHGSIGTYTDIDFFKFTGTVNDYIIIDIDAESFNSSLDSILSLYDTGQTLIAQNDDYPIGATDDPDNYLFVLDSHIEIEMPSSGTYYIKVESFSITSGSYKLRLFKSSTASDAAAAGVAFTQADFISDEIIVKYSAGVDIQHMKSIAGGYNVIKSDSNIERGVLCLLKLESSEKALLSSDAVKDRTLNEIKRLQSLPNIEYAEPNYIYKPLFTPNDEHYHYQWHYPLIKLDEVWNEDLINNISDVIVAVIDTGIGRSNGTKSGTNHEDLGISFVYEYDFISEPSISLDGDGMDNDATDPGDDPNGRFSSFHGTHVMGTIGAITNNSIGIAGVAGGNQNGAKIMPLRVLGAGGGAVYDIAQAVLYAAGLENGSGQLPGQKADIINMSIGSTANSTTLENAINDAYDEGVLIVASAGNEGTSVPYYPAAYVNVVSVTAVGPGAELASYSSYGNTVDLAAPGGDMSADMNIDSYPDGVLSALMDQNGSTYTSIYSFMQGTSMAAPHVSGVAALMKAANASLTSTQIRDKLQSSAIDIGQAGYDIYYGHGLINVYASVKSAMEATQSPVLFPFPKAVKLYGSNPEDSFTLKNIGGTGAISVTSITASQDPEGMVSEISPTSGTVEFSANVTLTTGGVEDGRNHYAMLEIVCSSGKKEYVYVIFNRDGFTGITENEDIGNVFVVALNSETFEPIALDVTTYSKNYIYTIEGLDTGSFLIVAGTDRDNDMYLCDRGEACGFYPVFGNPETVELENGVNITGIDFQVSDDALSGPGATSLKGLNLEQGIRIPR